MQHLEEGTIHAWLDGALDAADSSRIERHVAECGECAAMVAEARGLIAGATRIVSSLDVVRGNVIPAQPGKGSGKGSLWRSLRLTPGRAALAASLLIAAATMLSVHRLAPDMQSVASDLRDGRTAQPMAAAAMPSAPPAQPAEKRAASPVTRQAKSQDTSARDVQNAAASAKAIEKQRDVPRAAPVVAADEARRTPDMAQSAGASAARAVMAPMSAKPAPPPSPAQADAEKKVASAAVAQATSLVDSVRRNEAGAAVAAGAGARGARGGAGAAGAASGFAAARPLQLTEVVTTGLSADQIDVLGCYQIKPDSAEIFADGRAFPLRFALQHSPGTVNQNVVRAVTPDGRVDSLMAGSRWERMGSNTANVYWTPAAGASPQTITLRFAGNTVSAQTATPTGLKSVGVSRATCRP